MANRSRGASAYRIDPESGLEYELPPEELAEEKRARNLELWRRARQLRHTGKTLEAVAGHLGVSKSKVQRLLACPPKP